MSGDCGSMSGKSGSVESDKCGSMSAKSGECGV